MVNENRMEEVSTSRHQRISRMQVPGGWIYQITRNKSGLIATQFVPDATPKVINKIFGDKMEALILSDGRVFERRIEYTSTGGAYKSQDWGDWYEPKLPDITEE